MTRLPRTHLARRGASELTLVLFVVFAVLVLLAVVAYAVPRYNVYRSTASGEAELRKAEFTRKIAELDAQAEVQRARGVAEANKIIGESLKNNEGYLRYLWIQGLQTDSKSVVYVPTEAGLPILEAGKRP